MHRLLLVVLLTVMASAFPVDGFSGEGDAGGNVTFIVTSDSHYDAFENEDRNTRNRDTVDQMNAIATIRWPEKLGGDLIDKPRAVLLLGDVIDDGDRMREGKNQSAQQYAFFLADFGLDGTDGRLRYPVLEGWGNHDGPPVGRDRHGFSFQTHLKARNKRRLEKGLVQTVSVNGLHYAWLWDNVIFVQLNLYPGDKPHPGTRYNPQYHDPQGSLAFLKQVLATNTKPVIVAHHYDLQGSNWWHDEERKAYYDALKGTLVPAVFHGHTGTGLYLWKPDGETRPLNIVNTGQTENGFFVVQITKDRIRLAYRCKMGIKTEKLPDGKKRRTWDGVWGWRHTQNRPLK